MELSRSVAWLSSLCVTSVTMLALLVVPACGSSYKASPSTLLDSGIAGRAVLAPTCPVERIGDACKYGYRARIRVYTAVGRDLVSAFRAGPNGRFRVRLPAGRYRLVGAGPGPPRLGPIVVTVRPDHFTAITLTFDSGIR